LSFPEFYASSLGLGAARPDNMICTGPITYRGHAQLTRDIDNLKAALGGGDARRGVHASRFLPQTRGPAQERLHKSEEEYLFAFAEAMRENTWRSRRGFPAADRRPAARLALHAAAGLTIAQCRAWRSRASRRSITAARYPARKSPLPHLLQHQHGPRIHDMELKDVST